MYTYIHPHTHIQRVHTHAHTYPYTGLLFFCFFSIAKITIGDKDTESLKRYMTPYFSRKDEISSSFFFLFVCAHSEQADIAHACHGHTLQLSTGLCV